MIVTVGNVKGGVGKTTLAINLAIARATDGYDVLLIDGDEQGTAMTFTELRAELNGLPGYTAVSLQGSALRTQVRQLSSKYDEIVIDVGGRDTGSLRAALTVTDLLLIPVQPRSFDIWAVDQMAELIAEAREINDSMQAFVVLNAADAIGRDNEDAAEVLKEIQGIKVLDAVVVRRKVFPNAAAAGKGVLEYIPKDVKAIEEFTSLTNAVYIFNR